MPQKRLSPHQVITSVGSLLLGHLREETRRVRGIAAGHACVVFSDGDHRRGLLNAGWGQNQDGPALT